MNTQTPATSNRYRALFSLIFREALRNGKVTGNPARLVRQKHEDNQDEDRGIDHGEFLLSVISGPSPDL
jgi:hypothetical protein